MAVEFLEGRFGAKGWPVCRLGISGSYRPGERGIRRVLDEGVNVVFLYGVDSPTVRVVREMNADRRDRLVVITGAYNYIWGHQNLKKTLEKRLRQLRTEYIDLFLFLGVTNRKHFSDRVRGELQELRQDPRVRGVGFSCHDRTLAGEVAARGELDGMMVRYNAAHRGAEREVFPFLEAHQPEVVSYTATRWTYLLHKPRAWSGRTMTGGECYRFVLTNPNVSVCLMAPRSEREAMENLEAVRRGPLDADEMAWVREYGDAVHRSAGWFW